MDAKVRLREVIDDLPDGIGIEQAIDRILIRFGRLEDTHGPDSQAHLEKKDVLRKVDAWPK